LVVLYLGPAVLLLAVFIGYPVVYSIVRSLFDRSGSSFVGFHNYVSVFTDPNTRIALRNNLIWVLVAPAFVTGLGLIFAVLTERIRWAVAFRLVLFMPMAISLFASGIIFRLVYQQDPGLGLANAVTVSVHDIFAAQPVRSGGDLGIFLRAEDDLRHALAVAQIDEDDAVMIAIRVHPSGERDGLADVGGTKLITGVGAIHGGARNVAGFTRRWRRICTLGGRRRT